MGKHKKIYGLWERMDEVIADSGLSKSEIARRCGFMRNILADENAGRMLSIGTLAKFCSVMNVSSDYILGLTRRKRMNEFEKACEEANKDFTTEKENVIEFLKDAKTATVTFSQGRYITKIKNLAEKYPDKVEITAANADGTIVAHIPVSAIKINIIERNLSEEQKQEAAERLNKGRENIE